MAYPLPVTEQPITEPHGHPTNIRTVLTAPAADGWDYYQTQSRVQGTRLFIFNTIATPWWTEDELGS